MGGPAGSGRLRPWVLPTRRGGPGRRPQPQPDQNHRLLTPHEQPGPRARAGHVRLSLRLTGLPKDSVTNAPQILAVDRELLTERAGKLPADSLFRLLSGIDVVLGR